MFSFVLFLKSGGRNRPFLYISNMLFCCLQVLEELVNKKLSEDIVALYGTKLTCRLHLARLQLILAMCSTIHDLAEPITGI